MAFRIESIAALLIVQAPWPPVVFAPQHAVSTFVTLAGGTVDGAGLAFDGAGFVSIGAIAPLAESEDDCCFDRHPTTIDVADPSMTTHAATLMMFIGYPCPLR